MGGDQNTISVENHEMNCPGALRGIDTDEIFRQIEKLITGALEGGRQLMRSAIYDVLAKGGIVPDGQRGYLIIGHLALMGAIALPPGRASSKHLRYLMSG